MKIINEIIFWHSRKIPASLRSFLSIFFFLFIKTKNYFLYKDINMFHHVNIELNRSCNRRCSYCPISRYPKFNKESNINYKDYCNIISQLKEINFSGEIHFTGFYEPLLEKKLEKYIKYARKELKNVKIVVYTNGDFLNKKNLKFFKDYSIFLIISIHNDNKKNQRYKQIIKMTQQNNVIIKKNLNNHILSSRGGLIDVNKKDKKRFCILPSIELTIDSSGNIILCSDDFFSKNIFGNIKKEKIISIWNKVDFKKTRRNILKGKKKTKICVSCFS